MFSHDIECPQESPVRSHRIRGTKTGHYSGVHYLGGVEGLGMIRSPLEYCSALLDNTLVSGMVDFDYQLAE